MTSDIDPHDLVRDVATRGAAAGGLAASAIAGYVLSRTTGLPNATDDIGNWTEPLGLASLFVEGAVVAVSAYAFAMAGRVRVPSGARIPVRGNGLPVAA